MILQQRTRRGTRQISGNQIIFWQPDTTVLMNLAYGSAQRNGSILVNVHNFISSVHTHVFNVLKKKMKLFTSKEIAVDSISRLCTRVFSNQNDRIPTFKNVSIARKAEQFYSRMRLMRHYS